MYSSGTSSIRNFVRGCVLAVTFLVAVFHGGNAFGDILVKDGESVAFLGDSITQQGWDHPYGYVRLVMQGLQAQGLKIAPVPAGVSGDTSARMLSRTDGVLSKKPTWMTLSCGFNDMSPYCSWQVNIDDFKKNVTEILNKAKAAGVKVVILTPTLLQDNPEDTEFNQKAKPYAEFMRQIAKDRNLPLADMNEAHRAEVKRLKDAKAPYGLQADGIHMNPHGDQMMATVVLRTFGLTDEQIAKAKESWLNNVYRREIRDWKNITVRQFEKIELFAAREKIDVNEAIGLLWERALITATKANAGISKQSGIREAAQVQYSKDLDALLDTELSVKSLR